MNTSHRKDVILLMLYIGYANNLDMCIYACVYMYIYIYIYVHIECGGEIK
jgi:hypothetical protein